MLKIMIIEDDLDLLHGLRFLLQAYHCKICPLSDADEILKTVGLLQPDLILLDIKLDHSNGLDVCREIKNSYLKNIPVYIMSGLPDVDKKAYEAGADYFLPKPLILKHYWQKSKRWKLLPSKIIRKRKA